MRHGTKALVCFVGAAWSLTTLAAQAPVRLLKPGLWEVTTSLDKTWRGSVKACLTADRLAPSDVTLQLAGLTCVQRITKDTRTTIEVTSTCHTAGAPAGRSTPTLTSQIHIDERSPVALEGAITAHGGNLYRGLKTSLMGRWNGDTCDFAANPGLANIGSMALVGTPLALSEAVGGHATALPAREARPATYHLDEVQPGCSTPRLIRRVDAKYTPEAMRGKVQGDVEIEAVVQKDGSVGALRISKSLDPRYGLDFEAVWAARQWQFTPAKCDGQALDKAVTLQIQFRLH